MGALARQYKPHDLLPVSNYDSGLNTTRIMKILLVGLGGMAGSMLRYAVSMALLPWCLRVGFPVGTLTVNVAGGLLIGILAGLCREQVWFYLLAIGFCGGFTTFSAFSLEVVEMFRAGNVAGGALYIISSLVMSVAAVIGGIYIATKLR